jgi:Flp pilus assembly protein TadG
MMGATKHPAPARRRRGRQAGSTTLEFALIVSALLIACIGTVDLGLLMWSQEVMELAAADTARCVALGSSLCSAPNSPQSYAASIVNQYTFSGGLPNLQPGNTSPVWSQTGVTCTSTSSSQTSGNYTVVTITDSYWATTLSAFEPALLALGANVNRTVTACYPG